MLGGKRGAGVVGGRRNIPVYLSLFFGIALLLAVSLFYVLYVLLYPCSPALLLKLFLCAGWGFLDMFFFECV